MAELTGRFHRSLVRSWISTGLLTLCVPFFHIFLGIYQLRGTLPSLGLSSGLLGAGLFALIVSWGMRHRRWGLKFRLIFLIGLLTGSWFWSAFFGTGETSAGIWTLERYIDWILLIAQGLLSGFWYENLSGRSLLIRKLAPYSGDKLIQEKRNYNDETGFSRQQGSALMLCLGALALGVSLTEPSQGPGVPLTLLLCLDALVMGLLAWYRHEVDLLVLGLRHTPGALPRALLFLGASALAMLVTASVLPLEMLPSFSWEREARRMLVAETEEISQKALDALLQDQERQAGEDPLEPSDPVIPPENPLGRWIIQSLLASAVLGVLGWILYLGIIRPLQGKSPGFQLIRLQIGAKRLWGKIKVFLKHLFTRSRPSAPQEPETWKLSNSQIFLLNQISGKRKEKPSKTYPVILSGFLKILDWAGAHGVPYQPGETAAEFLTRAGGRWADCRPLLEKMAYLFNRGSFSGRELEASFLEEYLETVTRLRRRHPS